MLNPGVFCPALCWSLLGKDFIGEQMKEALFHPPQTAPARSGGQIPNPATEFGLWDFRSSGKEAAQGQDPSKNEALIADGFSSTQARQAS